MIREQLGALTERNFRLFFSSTTISAFGDGVSTVALSFAVLQVSHNSYLALTAVIAARQGAQTVVTLAAGVIADRLPRHLVLFGAATVQGVVQAISGALVLSGHASVWLLTLLAVVYGTADGFTLPAQQGLIPTIVSTLRLQQANALLGLTTSGLRLLGPALGGLLTGFGSPGAALEVDAATFIISAFLLIRVTISPRADAVAPERFFIELREGWAEFRRQRWISTTFMFFLWGNFFWGAWAVLGPYIAKQHLGGAIAWGFIGAASGAGAVVGGAIALRHKPRRIVLASCLWSLPFGLPMLALGLLLPLPVIIVVVFVQGATLALHLTLWFTAFQQQVPEESLSRVSSFDAMGSFVLIPVGMVASGLVASVIGPQATLIGAGALTMTANLLVFTRRAIYDIERTDLVPLAQEAT